MASTEIKFINFPEIFSQYYAAYVSEAAGFCGIKLLHGFSMKSLRK